jgi:hypothetical protein
MQINGYLKEWKFMEFDGKYEKQIGDIQTKEIELHT